MWLVLAVAVIATACSESTPPDDVVVETTVPIRAPRAEGFDGATVRFLVLADLTGPEAELDRARVTGLEAYWAAHNATGGYDGRYPVELLVRDHGGDVARAVQLITELGDEVMAVAFVSDGVADTVAVDAATAGLLMVPASATASAEVAPAILTTGLAVEAAVLSLFDGVEDASWCVVGDESAIGGRVVGVVGRAAELAGAAIPATYSVTSPELISDVAAATCSHVLVEVAVPLAPVAAAAVPAGRTLVARSVLGHRLPVVDGVEVVLVDDATVWDVDASAGMGRLVAVLAEHAPDVAPDPRVRSGFASQLQLDAIVATGFQRGDVSREALSSSVAEVGLIDMQGLAADVDRGAEPPEYPRQLRTFAVAEGSGGLGWEFLGGHRAPQVDALLAELVS